MRLSEDEERLIAGYRSLGDLGREKVLDYVGMLEDTGRYPSFELVVDDASEGQGAPMAVAGLMAEAARRGSER